MPSRFTCAGLRPRRLLPVEDDLARNRLVDPGQHVEDRRLAGAVRPDQADDGARTDLQGKARDRLQPRERDGAAARLEQNARALRRPPPAGGAASRLSERPQVELPIAEQALRAREHQHDQREPSRSPCGTPRSGAAARGAASGASADATEPLMLPMPPSTTMTMISIDRMKREASWCAGTHRSARTGRRRCRRRTRRRGRPVTL